MLIIGFGDVEARMHLAYKNKHMSVRYIHKVISISKHLMVAKNYYNTFNKGELES